jgi:putative DNA primase/helicase
MITISMFKNKFAKTPYDTLTLDIEGFKQFALDNEHKTLSSKEQSKLLSVCSYGVNNNRKKTNVEYISALVLDCDEGNSLEKVSAAIDELEPYLYWVYSTHSHTYEKPKVRFIIPISKAITVKEFESEKYTQRLAQFLGLTVDACSFIPSQAYYLPSTPIETEEDSEPFCDISVSNTLLNASSLPQLAVNKPAKNSSNTPSKKMPASYSYVEVDKLVASRYKNVAPIYVDGRLYSYADGVWKAGSAGMTLTRSLIESSNRELSIESAKSVIETLKVLHCADQFPASIDSKITLKDATLDTLTGTLEPHSPQNFHISNMDFNYDATATCPLWLKTLDEIFICDADKNLKIQFLQEWIGLLLVPETRHDKMVWLLGQGANGKSLILDVVTALLGDDNVCATSLDHLGGRFNDALHVGKLAIIASEIATDAVLKEDVIKKIVSGERMQAEFKGETPFMFYPTARIFAAANSLPISRDSTHGLERRIEIVTCNRKFTPAEMDKHLFEKIVKELPGIFMWAVAGLMRLTERRGLIEVPSNKVALQEFMTARNSVALFVRDCVKVNSDMDVKTAPIGAYALYHAYRKYCAANNYTPFANNRFGVKLKEIELCYRFTSGKRVYDVSLVDLKEHGVNPNEIEHTKPYAKVMLDDALRD